MAWKIKVHIESSVEPKKNCEESKVVVRFDGDPEKHKHEIYFFDFCPFQSRIRKYEVWNFTLKVKSLSFKEQNGEETFQTIFYCVHISPVSEMTRK